MLLIAYFLLAPLVIHPFHASVCEIEYNAQSTSLEISYRMFTDDLENALSAHFSAPVDILDPGQKSQNDSLVQLYLRDKMKFWANGEETSFQYLGSEIENGALWAYLEITEVNNLSTLEVDNSVMMELFSDQINLVHFNKEDQVRSLKLDKDRSYGILKLSDLWNE